MNLTTLEKVKSHLGISTADISKDVKIAALVPGVSKFIQGQCARDFEYQEFTLKIDGDGSDQLILPQYPVHEISAISVDGVAMESEDIAALDLDRESGCIYKSSGSWPAGRRNIVITFFAGYLEPDESESGDIAALPEDLVLAATRLTARAYERSTAEGTSSVSTGSFNVNFREAIDDDIKAIIGSYSRMRV